MGSNERSSSIWFPAGMAELITIFYLLKKQPIQCWLLVIDTHIPHARTCAENTGIVLLSPHSNCRYYTFINSYTILPIQKPSKNQKMFLLFVFSVVWYTPSVVAKIDLNYSKYWPEATYDFIYSTDNDYVSLQKVQGVVKDLLMLLHIA